MKKKKKMEVKVNEFQARDGNILLHTDLGHFFIHFDGVVFLEILKAVSPFEPPRPNIYKLFYDSISDDVEKLLIYETKNEEYFSKIILKDGKEIEIRPSDMIASFSAKEDIFIDTKLLNNKKTSKKNLKEELKEAIEEGDFKKAQIIQNEIDKGEKKCLLEQEDLETQ